jgi:RNA polymerase sigma-70 factor (ECF subfamily)
MPHMGLSDLIRSLRPRDRREADFDHLIREHIPALFRSAYRWTGAVDQAEDLVQELLTRLYPRLDELRSLDQVKPWAMRVMYRIFVDQLRRQRNSPVQFGLESDFDDESEHEEASVAEDLEPDMLVERQLQQERIAVAWAQLSEEHRIVLSMHDIEEYSLVEISAITETPVGTLKSRVHRARARLRDLLAREQSDGDVRVRD